MKRQVCPGDPIQPSVVTQPTTAHHTHGKSDVRSVWSVWSVVSVVTMQCQYNKIEVAAKDVVDGAELEEKQQVEEEEGEREGEVVCPSVYTLLLEQATRMFCISLLG